jgi:hypothetical protein
MNDEDEDSALARRHSAEALRVLAEIAVHLGPLIQELQAAGWLDDKMRFRDVSPWGQDDVMPAQSSTNNFT